MVPTRLPGSPRSVYTLTASLLPRRCSQFAPRAPIVEHAISNAFEWACLGRIALSLVITAELQFAIKDWSNLGLGYLYLLPVVIAGSWFGVRAATLVAAAATMIVTGWYASVPNTPTVATEAVSLMIRATAYVGVGVVVGLHSRKLRGFAYADPLTGLPNRRAFFERCDQAIAAGRNFGVLIADVDSLKQINDSLGHTAGDTAIREVAAALLAMLGTDAFVARVGGDEFMAVIPSDSVAAIRTDS